MAKKPEKQDGSRATQFKPGVSGNPGGQSKGPTIPKLLREITSKKVSLKDKRTKMQAILERAVKQAMAGHKEAREFVASRMEGKAIERIAQEIQLTDFTGGNAEEYVRSKLSNGD
ncbi:hypothetical protein LCGC14_1338200 [marine sediment metagenome]|uniref:DUF5681 domain-containing protein n=1 Tax=marine sediment metagenome TaxID=412755 RepID=A0A0F9NGR5_9ZZZZ